MKTARDKEKLKKTYKEWVSKNIDYVKAYRKEYYKKNKLHISEKSKKRYQKNKDIIKEKVSIYRKNNREKYLESISNSLIKRKKDDPIKHFSEKLYNSAKYRAKKKGIEFNITKSWVEEKLEKGICEASGIKIEFSKKYFRKGKSISSPFSPSLDKKDPSKGYTMENTQVVVWIYNSAKSSFSHSDVLILAKSLLLQEQLSTSVSPE